MHLSKKQIHQDTKRPQKHIVHPIRHRVQLLMQRLAHALRGLSAGLLLPLILRGDRGGGLAKRRDVLVLSHVGGDETNLQLKLWWNAVLLGDTS